MIQNPFQRVSRNKLLVRKTSSVLPTFIWCPFGGPTSQPMPLFPFLEHYRAHCLQGWKKCVAFSFSFFALPLSTFGRMCLIGELKDFGKLITHWCWATWARESHLDLKDWKDLCIFWGLLGSERLSAALLQVPMQRMKGENHTYVQFE